MLRRNSLREWQMTISISAVLIFSVSRARPRPLPRGRMDGFLSKPIKISDLRITLAAAEAIRSQ
jgi:hypothetical protein